MAWAQSLQEQIYQAWAFLTTGRVFAIILGVGFALLAIGLIIASRTKWGRAKPLTKFVVVSVMLHVWLLIYAIGDRPILPQGNLSGIEQNISVSFEPQAFDPPSLDSQAEYSNALEAAALAPVNSQSVAGSDSDPGPSDPGKASAEETQSFQDLAAPLEDLPKPYMLEGLDLSAELTPPELLPEPELTPLPALAPEELLVDSETEEPASEDSWTHDASSEFAVANANVPNPTEAPPQLPVAAVKPADAKSDDQRATLPEVNTSPVGTVPEMLSQGLPPVPATNEETPAPSFVSNESSTPGFDNRPKSTAQTTRLDPRQRSQTPLPQSYRLRQAKNRLNVASAFGADADTEAAVSAGLKWLAGAQSTQGFWNAAAFGAGTETHALGEYRSGTGSKADTGVSGLALLAFLSAGHTHLDGEYRETVGLGLAFLLDAQMPSGDMSGPKQVGNTANALNSRMYCHGIATLALAEAYAMTHDRQLRDALVKAAQYTVNAQDVRGGGWRYRPGEPGDLSQFGWQAMALNSVQRSGISVPISVQGRMQRFLDSCAAGQFGGLATYRPRMGRPSTTMTAEALACRLLLGFPLSPEAKREATTYLMSDRPGAKAGELDNIYCWYYATLALFQLQDENWRVWNQALKARLLQTQVPAYGDEPGSWKPDSLWGGYGGRVYTTAMSCLCLEVYYRYLPMYQHNVAGASMPRTSRY